MASLLRSWARRAVRVARDMVDVSPISATNAVVAEFRTEQCVAKKWRSWSDAPHGGLSTCEVRYRNLTRQEQSGWFRTQGGSRNETQSDGFDDRNDWAKQSPTGVMVLRGALSLKTTAPLRDELPGLETGSIESDPESLLSDEETKRSGYEIRLAAVSGITENKTNLTAFAASETKSADISQPAEPKPLEPLKMKRTGFAGCSSTDLPAHEFLDLDAFTALKLNVKSDGRKYVVSLRTENWITGGKEDLWQAFLFAPAGRWVTVYIPTSRFLKTWRGRVMEHEHEMNASKVVGIGIAVAGGGEVELAGPFSLEIASVTGVRLAPEALEMAKRKEEASWGVDTGVGNGSETTRNMAQVRSQGESDIFREHTDDADTDETGLQKTAVPSVASEDLRIAARALRRAAEADRALIESASAPRVKNTGLGSNKTQFKGEMLPEFLGRKPENE